MVNTVEFSFVLSICVLGCGAYALFHVINRRLTQASHSLITFLVCVCIGVGFTVLEILIPRAIEYGRIFLTISVAILLGQLIIPTCLHYHAYVHARAGEIGDLYRSLHVFLNSIVRDKRFYRPLYVMVTFGILVTPLLIATTIMIHRPLFEENMFLGVTQYLADTPQHLVLTQHFHDYPLLIYHNPTNRFTSGFDSRFIHLYNEGIGSAVTEFWGTGTQCISVECEVGTLPAILTEAGVTHVLIDERLVRPEVLSALSLSTSFAMVFIDEEYPYIKLYKIQL